MKRESDEGTSVKKVVVIGESVSTDCVSGVMNKNNMEMLRDYNEWIMKYY